MKSEARTNFGSTIVPDSIYLVEDIDKRPEPIKGIEHFYGKVAKSYHYPADAVKNGISGKIVLYVTIDKKGHLIDASIKEGLGFGVDEEAVRVFKKVHVKWHPGIKNNESVVTKMLMPLVLKID